jgi:AcrR family transcriptional regulator
MSVTQVRKERERAEREALILDHAQRLLVRDGFQDLNLDELASAVEYSKGTLYLHFESKEDLTLAIATRAARERADLFERASKFQGRSRERMRAIGFACCQFAIMHRDYFNVEMMLKSASFWEKASVERRRLHGVQAGRLFQTTNAIAVEAQAVGDLSREHRAVDVTLSLFAITMGSHIVAMQPDVQLLAGIEDPICLVRQNQDRVCDGWGWKPLLADWDYAATDRRIRDEVFPEASWLKTA